MSRHVGRRSRTLLLLALALHVVPALGRAQTRETQRELFPERGIEVVDADLAQRLGLFRDIDGFIAARLFETSDGDLVLEITMDSGGRLVRERIVLDEAALARLRASIAEALETTGAAIDQSGRTGLILGHTVLGLGFYGWAIPNALDITGFQGVFSAYLLTAGISFTAPLLLTRSSEVGIAQRNGSLWGATRGIPAGLLIGGLINTDDDSDKYNEVRLGSAVATSVLGSVLGYNAVGWLNASRGRVEALGVFGDLGLAGGFAASYGLGLYDPPERFVGGFPVPDDFDDTREGDAVALGVAAATMAIGAWRTRNETYTVGDAHVLRATGILGAQLGLPIGREIDEEGDKPVVWSGIIGATAGTILADGLLLSEKEFSGSEGLLITAAQVAGGLIGAGLTILADEDAEDTVVLTTSALGSAIGFGAMYATFADRAGARSERASSGFRAQFELGGLLLPLMYGKGRDGPAASAPLLRLTF